MPCIQILGKPSKEGSLDLESGKVLGKPSKEANTDTHSHSNKKFVEALKKPLQEGNGSFFNHVVSSDSMKNRIPRDVISEKRKGRNLLLVFEFRSFSWHCRLTLTLHPVVSYTGIRVGGNLNVSMYQSHLTATEDAQTEV